MEWIQGERRKRGRPRKRWMERVWAAMETRHLEADQWLNRKKWCLGSGRRRQLSLDQRQIDRNFYAQCTKALYLSIWHNKPHNCCTAHMPVRKTSELLLSDVFMCVPLRPMSTSS
jgi:hypothetical protein